MQVKHITIGFQVPEDTDWPSEKLALAKQMLLDALQHHQSDGRFYKLSSQDGVTNVYQDEADVAEALLTES